MGVKIIFTKVISVFGENLLVVHPPQSRNRVHIKHVFLPGNRILNIAAGFTSGPSGWPGGRSKNTPGGNPNRFNIPDCPERCSWMMHHLISRMVGTGFLKRSRTEIRRHNPVGDTLFFDGKVTGKIVEDGEGLMEIEQDGVNQDGELSLNPWGTVLLPRRNLE